VLIAASTRSSDRNALGLSGVAFTRHQVNTLSNAATYPVVVQITACESVASAAFQFELAHELYSLQEGQVRFERCPVHCTSTSWQISSEEWAFTYVEVA
jgi:hypothetical protein